MDKMGRGLVQGVAAYNRGIGSFHLRILPQARHFDSLGVIGESERIKDVVKIEKIVCQSDTDG